MKLVIAEKPSVAQDIAKIIGADDYTNGVLRGNGYIVTSASGHLVQLKDPDDYDEKYKEWNVDDLPIPPVFEFMPKKAYDKSGKRDLEKEQRLLEILERLSGLMDSSDVDEIIEATDAGREGECIFRYIYNYIGCTKPVKRLWISSMTEQSIRDGFANLKPFSDYDKMFAAGFARNKLDWLWGMNLSRLYTKCFGAMCSVGRVQTAVVNMIVQRDNDIANFTKKPFFKVKLENGAEWFDEEDDSFPEKTQAEAVKAKCENRLCTVVSAETKLKKENRPLLFSLTSLQIEANEKLGFTAEHTLDTMQSLYEKKLLTYPRTDSNFLTDDMAAILPERVKLLHDYYPAEVDEITSSGSNIDGRIINNAKVSDHHAIIPTENIANADKSELSDDENAILNTVITRFLAALSAQYEYSETEYVFEVNGEKFRCKSKTPVKVGWKAFYADKESGESISVSYSQGESFQAENLVISECETQPPKHFSESALLKAMANIDRRIEDKELAEYVSERGLGTPATRDKIIKTIIKRGYVERKNKSLISTEKGRKLIANLPDEVKSIEMTAAMELQLSAIEKGTADASEVITSICGRINSIISLEKSREHVSLAPPRDPFGICPKCGANVFKYTGKDGKTVWYCEKSSSKNNEQPCNFRLYEDDYFFSSKGKKITDSIMKSLLTKKKAKISGLKSKDKDRTYDAVISFGKDWIGKDGKPRIGFAMEFDNTQKRVRKGGK